MDVRVMYPMQPPQCGCRMKQHVLEFSRTSKAMTLTFDRSMIRLPDGAG
jgi:hypothetical protein